MMVASFRVIATEVLVAGTIDDARDYPREIVTCVCSRIQAL
jgi:DNA repair protein RadC